MKEEININEEKINSAYKNKTKIHVALKDNTFRNGYVTYLGADFFMLNDNINGSEPLFYLEVWNVEPYMEERKDGKES